MGSLAPRGHLHHGDVGYRFVLDRAVQRRSNRSALAFLIAVVESLIQCNPRKELTIDLLSLGLPHRSIDSPLSFERVAIPSTEFAI